MAGQLAAETTPGVFDTVATSDGPKRQAEDPAPGAAFGHVRAGPGAERRGAAERHQQPGVVEPRRPSVSRPSLRFAAGRLAKAKRVFKNRTKRSGTPPAPDQREDH